MKSANEHPRLRAARIAAGHHSAARFARLVGLEEGTYRSYENGARPLTIRAAKAIASHLRDEQRTWQWLMLGEDADAHSLSEIESRERMSEPRRRDPYARAPGEVVQIDTFLEAGAGAAAADLDNWTADDYSASREATSGRRRFPPEYLRYELNINEKRSFILPVKGDSMEPTLRSGDRVIVDVDDRTPTPPGMFALWNGEGLLVKRLERTGTGSAARVRASSDNPRHPPFDFEGDEMTIIGRVVLMVRKT